MRAGRPMDDSHSLACRPRIMAAVLAALAKAQQAAATETVRQYGAAGVPAVGSSM